MSGAHCLLWKPWSPGVRPVIVYVILHLSSSVMAKVIVPVHLPAGSGPWPHGRPFGPTSQTAKRSCMEPSRVFTSCGPLRAGAGSHFRRCVVRVFEEVFLCASVRGGLFGSLT